MNKSPDYSKLEKDFSTCKQSIIEFKNIAYELQMIDIENNEAKAEILISFVRNIRDLIIKKMEIWLN